MESKNKNHSTVETTSIPSLQEVWERFVNHHETLDDLNLIMSSIRKGEGLQECHEVLDRKWDETFEVDKPLERRELKKYKRKVRRMYAEYHRNRKTHSYPSPSRRLTSFSKIWYAAAAAILLGMLIPAARLLINPQNEQVVVAVHYIEEVTGRGEIKTIVLPDQTKVTLNVESRLKYPAIFGGERSVELQGGAIFEVTPDSERPFTVMTTDLKVKVLGTVFDVKAYPDDESLVVSVAAGKVSVETLHAAFSEMPVTGGMTESLHTISQLGKNHQLKINKITGNFEKLTIDAEKYLSWTEGSLYFFETPIREVVNMLNRLNLQMVYELAEGDYSNLISGKLNTKNLETMLDAYILSSGLQYKKTENKIILYNDHHH